MLDDAIVKELCERASQESDAKKAAELLESLRNLIEMENDETRLRIRQILLHYRHNGPIAALADKPRNSISSFLAALIHGKRLIRHQGN
jgi:hypothetical protein